MCLCVCPSVTQMLDYWSVPLEFPRGQMSMTWLIGRHCDPRCLCSSDRPRELGLLLRGSEDQTHCTVIAISPQAARRLYTEEQALPSFLWVCEWVVGLVYVCVRRACVGSCDRATVRACVGGRDKEGQSWASLCLEKVTAAFSLRFGEWVEVYN